MGALSQDLRYAARTLLSRPGFTLAAVLTLALGVGANATIFSLANAVLLRPLPVSEPERVMSLYSVARDGTQSGRFSWPDFADLRAQNEVFAGMSAQMQTLVTLGTADQAETVFGEVSDGNYFRLLGVGAAAGRTFTPEDDSPAAPRVAVIGFNLWARRFGGDPSVVGRTVHLNGEQFTVVGVVKRGYTGTRVVPAVEVWVPLQQGGRWLGPDWQTNRERPALQVVGRLRDGVTREQAQGALTAVAGRLAQSYPARNRASAVALERTSLAEGRRRTMISAFLSILLAVTGLVLVVACANVANLMLVRAVGRRRELAVRQALGATRWRLVRQFLAEGLLVALAGGAAGLLVSVYAADLLQNFNPLPSFPLKFDLTPDARVVGFSLAVSLLAGVLMSAAPALGATKHDLATALKADSRSGTSSPHRSRLRGALAVAQTALSLVLLVGAGLLFRSVQNMQAAPPGFDPDNVVAMDFDLSLKGLTEEEGRRYFRDVLARVSSLPGVESATFASRAPLDISTPTLGAEIEGHAPPPGRDDIPLSFYRVTPGYFATTRIPVLRGRGITERDDERAPRVAVVNETLARRFWPGEEAVGKRFRLTERSARGAGEEGAGVGGEVEVVGVAKDSKYRTLGEEPTPLVYLPLWQHHTVGMALLVRARTPAAETLRAVRGELLAIDRAPQGFFARTMHEHMAVVVAPGRIAATLLGVSGLVALLLASVGLYGVMSYAGSQRIQEMGIRVALGAERRDIFRLMIGQGLRLALVGVGLGLAASLALTRFLRGLLFGVGALDPLTFAGTALLLLATAALACYLPARRATRVDPMEALRYE